MNTKWRWLPGVAVTPILGATIGSSLAHLAGFSADSRVVFACLCGTLTALCLISFIVVIERQKTKQLGQRYEAQLIIARCVSRGMRAMTRRSQRVSAPTEQANVMAMLKDLAELLKASRDLSIPSSEQSAQGHSVRSARSKSDKQSPNGHAADLLPEDLRQAHPRQGRSDPPGK